MGELLLACACGENKSPPEEGLVLRARVTTPQGVPIPHAVLGLPGQRHWTDELGEVSTAFYFMRRQSVDVQLICPPGFLALEASRRLLPPWRGEQGGVRHLKFSCRPEHLRLGLAVWVEGGIEARVSLSGRELGVTRWGVFTGVASVSSAQEVELVVEPLDETRRLLGARRVIPIADRDQWVVQRVFSEPRISSRSATKPQKKGSSSPHWIPQRL